MIGAIALVAGSLVMAQPRPDRGRPSGPPPRRSSPATTLPAPRVEIQERDGFRIIKSNGIPNHKTGQFPSDKNPNAIAAQDWEFRVTLSPKVNERPTGVRMNLFGVAINGIPFDPATAEFWRGERGSEWNEDAQIGTGKLGMDQSNAHVQPGGIYHYHGIPLGLVAELKDKSDGRMILMGWAADGFPMYALLAHENADDAKSALKPMRSSYRLKKGTRPAGSQGPGGKYNGTYVSDWEYVQGAGDLDECNGRTGVTPEFPEGTYYYVLSDDFPFVPRMWRGTPDPSFMKQGPGRGDPGDPSRRRPGPPGDRDDRRPPPPPRD